MMRFKKGSKVEVLSRKEVSSGAWHCAEILSGNGHNYDVKYSRSPGTTNEVALERVSRKDIRPCPPLVEGADGWVPGGLVEVFENNSWKIATISDVVDGNYFFVRFLGSPRKFRVHKSDLRVRQSWQDNKWVVVGQGSVRCEDGKSNKLSTSSFYEKPNHQVLQKSAKTKFYVEDGPLPVENNCLLESDVAPSRTLKRGSPNCSFHVEALTGASRKLRLIEKDNRHQRVITNHPSPLLEKGQSWRLVQLASKILKMTVGSCHLSPGVDNGEYLHPIPYNKRTNDELFVPLTILIRWVLTLCAVLKEVILHYF
ncbi:uncharacterized protein LOC122073434 isoform X2 [Macadamia integrifolia]|uniref:uncharacterized protein LOC122073434 isoform X2 n=1 Tax=Macadamia integrifolia TaxID=60698 RepID=UPI001C4EDCC7|nr:uncharacterized protein LOC122073434 isoform X2 [Macadamia integrifolia]